MSLSYINPRPCLNQIYFPKVNPRPCLNQIKKPILFWELIRESTQFLVSCKKAHAYPPNLNGQNIRDKYSMHNSEGILSNIVNFAKSNIRLDVF